jgi:excisionase family DNA binding protein
MVRNDASQERPMLDEAPDVLTPEETAKLLRIGRNAAYEAIQRGDIPSVRIGRRILVPKLALQRMLGEVTRKE